MNAHQRRIALRESSRNISPTTEGNEKFRKLFVDLSTRKHSARPCRHQMPTKDYRVKPFSAWSRYEW